MKSNTGHLPKFYVLLVFISVLPFHCLNASLETEVPEVPNIFTFLHSLYHSPWVNTLVEWENIIFSFVLAVFISVVFCLGARKRNSVPSGFQNFLETVVEMLQKFANEVLGVHGERYVPFLGTLFIYILLMNWMVLIPFMKAPSSSASVTAGLAISVFVLVQFLSFKNWGFKGYLYHLAGSPKSILEWILVPLMLPIELLTQLTRPVTLAFRLFGNVTGEDILIGFFAVFGASLLAHWSIPMGLPLQLPFMLFAMLTGFMQALVFTLLTAIYILLSLPEDHGEVK